MLRLDAVGVRRWACPHGCCLRITSIIWFSVTKISVPYQIDGVCLDWDTACSCVHSKYGGANLTNLFKFNSLPSFKVSSTLFITNIKV